MGTADDAISRCKKGDGVLTLADGARIAQASEDVRTALGRLLSRTSRLCPVPRLRPKRTPPTPTPMIVESFPG